MTDTGLSPPQLLELYRLMSMARRLEERLALLSGRANLAGDVSREKGIGREGSPTDTALIRGGAEGMGREATSVGAAFALAAGDFVAPSFRDLGAVLARGCPPRTLFLQALARSGGPCGGKDGNLHFCDLERGVMGGTSAPGAMVPVVVGLLLGARMQGRNCAAVAFIIGGATSTGQFHEGLSLAAVRGLPLVVVIENDSSFPSAGVLRDAGLESLADRAIAYGIPSELVDGGDVLAVHDATRRAAERARMGKGPTLLEARMPVPPDDPIARFRTRLVSEGAGWADEMDAIDLRVESEMEDAERDAAVSPLPQAGSALAGVTGPEAGGSTPQSR